LKSDNEGFLRFEGGSGEIDMLKGAKVVTVNNNLVECNSEAALNSLIDTINNATRPAIIGFSNLFNVGERNLRLKQEKVAESFGLESGYRLTEKGEVIGSNGMMCEEEAVVVSETAALVAAATKDFPPGWIVERQADYHYKITSPSGEIFTTKKEARRALEKMGEARELPEEKNDENRNDGQMLKRKRNSEDGGGGEDG